MRTYIVSAYYRSLKTSSYHLVATVHVPQHLDALDVAEIVLDHQPEPEGVSFHKKHDLPTLRSMYPCDILEYGCKDADSGKYAPHAFVLTETQFVEIEYREEHDYPLFFTDAETLFMQQGAPEPVLI